MTATKFLLFPFLFFLSLLTNASCLQADQQRASIMAQKSKARLQSLYKREFASAGGELSRSSVILAVYMVSEGKLDARSVEFLSHHVQDHPDDHFAKLYEGYAWIFSAEKYNKQKNYLRAAEYLKRGFFLIDEAVDSDPKNWRLRYLRMRLDAFVPTDLGRYVVALKDASVLIEELRQLPPGIRPLVYALRSSSMERSGKTAVATSDFDTVRVQFQETDIAALSSACALQGFVTAEEISELLEYALSQKK